MASRQSTLAPLVPLALGQPGGNTTFVLDCSADMQAGLESVKELLVQTLVSKASRRDSLFNMVSFSGKVNCWSPYMRPCTAHSVYTALSWIRSITCGPGKDFLSALTLALADPSCQVVQLLSTSLPDQAAAALRVLPDLAAGRPVNMFYLLDEGRQLDVHTRDYLHGLTCATGGSCYVIPVNHCGDLDQPIPLHCAENTCAVQCCCPPISACLPAQGRTSTLLFRGHLLHPATSCELPARTLSSSEFFPGCRVLARKEIDAFYYLATVIQQVQGHRGVWVVEFDCTGSVILGADFPWRRQQQQLVCSPDMVKHCETSPASLHCGVAVLSPWEPHLRRYGPGRVTAVRVHGDTCGVAAMNWTGEHRAFIVETFIKTNESVTATQRAFRLHFNLGRHDPVPAGNTILLWVTNFRAAGSALREVQSMLQVQMWHACISLVPASLVQPISAPHYSRIVLELHKQTSSLHGSCSSWCVSACCLHPSTKCWSCSAYNRWNVGSSLERINGCDTTQTDDVMEDDTNVALSSSSDDEGALLPAVKRRGTQQRLPWRYWRRTGPEPQCTQRVRAASSSSSARSNVPIPQSSASPNHSSQFQSLPGSTPNHSPVSQSMSGSRGRMANIGPAFGVTSFKRQTSGHRRGCQSSSNSRAASTRC